MTTAVGTRTPTPEFPGVHALLGDVVRSRAVLDRAALHSTLVRALERVEALVPALDPLVVTVGDEFQGIYRTAGDAVLASLLVRLELLPDLDVRCGLGLGDVDVVDRDRTPVLQDGSAWWAARDAVQEAERRAQAAATRACRTWYVQADGHEDPALEAAVRAVLVLRDELVGGLDERPLRVLRGVMSDLTQTLVAEQEGITQSAVSQIVARGGLAAVREAHALLRPHAT